MATKKPIGPTLFEMSEELNLLMEDMEVWAEDNEGDLTEYPTDRFDKLEGEVKVKALKCARLYKEWKAQAAAIAAEKKNLTKREKAHDNRGERLKAYLESCLPPNAKFEDERSAISWKNNPPAVELLVDAKILPTRFLKRPPPEAALAELKAEMTAFEVPVLDATGLQVFDMDKKPMTRTELQVRWPLPTGEKKLVQGDEDGGEPVEVDVLEERPIARMVQGRSLRIE